MLAPIKPDLKIERTNSLESGQAALSKDAHDVILVDLDLPDCTGVETLHRLREQKPEVPIVVLSAEPDRESAEDAVRAGAHDYLVEDRVTGEAVARCLRYAVERSRSQERLRAAEQALEKKQRLEALGQLAGGIAHDFNNMLAVILGYAELASSELEPEDPQFDSIQEIIKTSSKARGLTRKLLAFGRRQMLEPKILDLRPWSRTCARCSTRR